MHWAEEEKLVAKTGLGGNSPEGAHGGASLVALQDNQAVLLKPRADFYESDRLRSLQFRALSYLEAGVPVHFRGPAGTGKTTLAMEIAASIGQPTSIIVGDNWHTSADFIGENVGVRTKHVQDRYVHSVKRSETESEQVWADNVLTRAITQGHTLIYDEFTRSTPEANNPLLMALEERMIVIPGHGNGNRYVEAHPNFRAILTSNPDDYAGVKAPQDALIDRMITLDIDHYERDTEVGIVTKRTGLTFDKAADIVDIVRAVRLGDMSGQTPSIRAAMMIGKIVHAANLDIRATNPAFVQLCFDVLKSKAPSARNDDAAHKAFHNALVAAIKKAAKPDASKSRKTADPVELKEAS